MSNLLSRRFSSNVLTANPSIPEGWSESQCCHCRAVILIDDSTHEAPECVRCLRGQAEFEGFRAIREVLGLINGTAEYECLSLGERQEQLAPLGLAAKPRAGEPDATERARIEDEAEQQRDCDNGEDAERWDGLS